MYKPLKEMINVCSFFYGKVGINTKTEEVVTHALILLRLEPIRTYFQ
jgi:hypothetical protein